MAKPKIRPPTHEGFVFRISAPSFSYAFAVQHDRRLQDVQPFEERETTQFLTECLSPDRFAGREGKATIYPEPALAQPKLLDKDDVRRKWIGYIKATRREFETVIWLPPQVGWRLGEAMSSSLISSMLTNGLIEARGMNRVTSVSFYGPEFDPTEYVG